MGRSATFLILAGLLLGTSGCNGDRSSKAASNFDATQTETTAGIAAPVAKQAEDQTITVKDNRPLVVCFGDSLTAGHGADLGASYPDFLQKDVDRDRLHARVVNEGISGDTTKDGLDRIPEIIALKPTIVVLEFGGNDGLRGLNLQTTRQNLASMIEVLKAAHIKVIVAGMTLPPDYGADYISHFTGNYSSLGKQYHVPVLPFLLQNVYGVAGMMQPDRTHATNRGNEIVAKNVLPYVEKLLKK